MKRKGKLARHVIEGVWSGYTSSQSHVVHREVSTSRALIEWARETYAISFTDGTSLNLSVRPCKPRERVIEKHGYTSLIRDCHYYNVTSVAELGDAKRRRALLQSQQQGISC